MPDNQVNNNLVSTAHNYVFTCWPLGTIELIIHLINAAGNYRVVKKFRTTVAGSQALFFKLPVVSYFSSSCTLPPLSHPSISPALNIRGENPSHPLSVGNFNLNKRQRKLKRDKTELNKNRKKSKIQPGQIPQEFLLSLQHPHPCGKDNRREQEGPKLSSCDP